MIVKKPHQRRWLLALFLCTFPMLGEWAWAGGTSAVREVKLYPRSHEVRVKLSRRASCKTVQIDNNELLLAFRNTVAPENLRVSGDGGGLIKNVRVERSSTAGVVSLIISTAGRIKGFKARWAGAATFVVKLEALSDMAVHGGGQGKGGARKKIKRVIKKGRIILAPRGGVTAVPVAESPVAVSGGVPPSPVDGKFSGTIDDLLLELRVDACPDNDEIKRGVLLCRRGNWENAFILFSRYITNDILGTRCLENVYILRAFSFYKNMLKKGESANIEAASYLQDFISYFPDSLYMPYAATCLGLIHKKMDNSVEAKGYFDLVLTEYQAYPGTPEVMLELGRIYLEKKKTGEAIDILEKAIKRFPRGGFATEAKLELGKACFGENDFRRAAKILDQVLKEAPRKAYKNPDLLLYLGNAYYHTGRSAEARAVLSRVYNLFTEIESRDTILTRIGDTYMENGEREKAIKIFQLVVDNYPGSDGFVISSMRLAEYLESGEEKEKIYNMIIEDFPENPLSRLALMRLAVLQNGSGEYVKSTETVKKLLERKPRALKREAVKLFRRASESIFKAQLEKGEYIKLLKRFENDKRLLDEADSPGLFALVGKAYLRAHLFDNAVEFLTRAYDRPHKGKRSADLVFSLGVALDESGRDEEALKLFKEYLRSYPGARGEPAAHMRMGKIMLGRERFSVAAYHFQNAYLISENDVFKAESLMCQAGALTGMGKSDKAAPLLIKAINNLAGVPEERFDMLFAAHRNLGDNYMKLKSYDKAADAFSMAVKFAGKDENVAEVHFLLGEAYRLGGYPDKAAGAYARVDEAGDSFWSSMASQRLRSMKLRTKLGND